MLEGPKRNYQKKAEVARRSLSWKVVKFSFGVEGNKVNLEKSCYEFVILAALLKVYLSFCYEFCY